MNDDEIRMTPHVYAIHRQHFYGEWSHHVYNMTFVTAPESDDIIIKDKESIEEWKKAFLVEIEKVQSSPFRDQLEYQEWLRDMQASRFIPGEREILVKRPVR